MTDGAKMIPPVSWNRSRVIPEIQAVYRFVIHPDTSMMRMIGTISGFWRQRVSSGNSNSIQGINREKKRFENRIIITIGCQQFPVIQDVDLFFVRLRNYTETFFLCRKVGRYHKHCLLYTSPSPRD